MDAENSSGTRTIAAINLILGAWLAVSPWVLGLSVVAQNNNLIVGLLIVAFSAIRLFFPSQVWASWLNIFAGLWLILAPFILNFATSAANWNQIIVGIVVTILAFSNLSTYGRHTTA